MADNVELNAGTGGATAATDDVAGVHFQKVKIDVGGDGASSPLSNSAPLPVSDAGGSLTVDGTVAVTHAALTELAAALIPEDTAHSSTDTGIMAMFVRQDAQADFAADGDYVPGSIDADGNLRVVIPSTAVTNAGTFAVQAAQSGTWNVTVNAAIAAGNNNIGDVDIASIAAGNNNIGDVDVASLPASTNTLEVVGDAAHDAAAAGNPVLVGGYASAAAPTDVSADADVVRAWYLRNGARATVLTAAGALIPGDATNGLDIDVTRMSALVASSANIGDVDVLTIAAGDNNIGNVDIVTMPSVTLAASTGTQEVVGDVAHDAAAAGNPVQVGGYATNNIEAITQVAAADLTRTIYDLNGVIVTRPHTTLEEIQTVRTTNTDGASTSLISAAGSGVHNYVTNVTIWNSSATDGFVDFRDGTAGSVIYTFPAPQTGGCTVSFNPPLKFGDNTAVAYDASGAITTIYISAVFFQAQG